jgi:hypothetical protein
VGSAWAMKSRVLDVASCMELPGTPQKWLFCSWSAIICLRRLAKIRARSLYSVVRRGIGRYTSQKRGMAFLDRHTIIPCFCIRDMCLSRNIWFVI